MRKQSLIEKIEKELKILESKVKFVRAIVNDELIVFKRKKQEIVTNVKKMGLYENPNYDYLMNMPIHTFTEETINENTKTEYLAVKRPDGKYEIHMKTGGGEYKEFKLPPDGSIWTNDGKGYNSESEAQSKIREIKNRIKPEEDRYGEKTGDGYYIDETTLSQEFNDDNEGDKEEVDTDQIEEQDDVPLDEIT